MEVEKQSPILRESGPHIDSVGAYFSFASLISPGSLMFYSSWINVYEKYFSAKYQERLAFIEVAGLLTSTFVARAPLAQWHAAPNSFYRRLLSTRILANTSAKTSVKQKRGVPIAPTSLRCQLLLMHSLTSLFNFLRDPRFRPLSQAYL